MRKCNTVQLSPEIKTSGAIAFDQNGRLCISDLSSGSIHSIAIYNVKNNGISVRGNIHQKLDINMKEIYWLVVNGEAMYIASAADVDGIYTT